MAQLSAFDVLGPNMIGPSSSHTAGAAVIAYLAQKMINGPIIKATFTLYGSFAHTYSGHGTDRALLGGLLGFHTDDKRIRDSFRIASGRYLRISGTVKPFPEDYTGYVSVYCPGYISAFPVGSRRKRKRERQHLQINHKVLLPCTFPDSPPASDHLYLSLSLRTSWLSGKQNSCSAARASPCSLSHLHRL